MVSKKIYSSSKMPERQRNTPLVNLQNKCVWHQNNQIFQRAVQILKYIMIAPKSLWHTKKYYWLITPSTGIILKSTPINQYGDTPVRKSAEMTFQHWSYRGRCNKGDGWYELLAITVILEVTRGQISNNSKNSLLVIKSSEF